MLQKQPYWAEPTFPELSADWFRERGVADPTQVHREWTLWLADRPRSNQAKFRRALAKATGVGDAAVGFWLTKERNSITNLSDRLSIKKLKDLDSTSAALGRPPWNLCTIPMQSIRSNEKLIVVLAELASVPSPRYHLTVLESIARACGEVNFSVALNGVSQSDPDMSKRVGSILRSHSPDGIIWFRLTPDQASLRELGEYSSILPCVLIHASRLKYPRPVIANILPGQTPIRTAVAQWSRTMPPNGSHEILVTAMRPDDLSVDFPTIAKSTSVNIREERISLIVNGIRDSNKEPVVHYVSDYSASQAECLAQHYPRALGYVCLSDEIAIGLRQLLRAYGNNDVEGRILGFDGSEMARQHQIPSFDQRLPDLGDKLVDLFLSEFRQPSPRGIEGSLQKFREIAIELELRT